MWSSYFKSLECFRGCWMAKVLYCRRLWPSNQRETLVRRRTLGPLLALRGTRNAFGGPSLPLTRVLYPKTSVESSRIPGHSSVQRLRQLPRARIWRKWDWINEPVAKLWVFRSRQLQLLPKYRNLNDVNILCHSSCLVVGPRGPIFRKISNPSSQVDKSELKKFEIVLSWVRFLMNNSPEWFDHLQSLSFSRLIQELFVAESAGASLVQ